MKKRIPALLAALTVSASLLSGCMTNANEGNNSRNDNVHKVSDKPSGEVVSDLSDLYEMLTLAPGDLIGEQINLSDEDGLEINRLIAENEMNFLASTGMAGTKVQSRDWSKYTSPTAKQKLTYAEAAFYDRLDAVCKEYLNDPSHGIVQWDDFYTLKGAAYSDLGLDKNQAYDVLWWFKYNNPQYYFLDHAKYTNSDLFLYVYDFIEEINDKAELTNEIFDKLDSWIAECSDDELTAWDKVLSINKKICEAVIYDPKVAAGASSAGKDQSIYSVMMTPETVCAGYALTFGAMANALDIDSLIVLSNTHAWNAVQFGDDKYYFVDVCWNDKDNGYDENFIGVGTDYTTYYDKGKSSHIYKAEQANWSPVIPKYDYQGDDNTKLSAPDIRVSGSGSRAVKIEWSAVDNAEKYEFSINNGADLIFKGTTKDTSVYTTLPEGAKSVTAKVRAIGKMDGSDARSKWSETEAAAKDPSDKPAAPSNVKAEIREGKQLWITWDKVKDVNRHPYITFLDETCTTVTSDYCSSSTGLFYSNWTSKDDLFFCLMSAKQSSGNEVLSDPVYFKYNPTDGLTPISKTATQSAKIDAPAGFKATAEGNKVTCTWTAANNADSYDLQVSYKSDFSDIAGSSYCENNETSASFTAPDNVNKAYVRIRAAKKDGYVTLYSDWTAADCTIEKKTVSADKPAAPANFKGEALAQEKSKFTWNAVPGATGYNIALFNDAEHKKLWADYSVTATLVHFSPLNENSTYHFGIRSVKSENGVDVYSDWVYLEYTQKYTADTNSGGDNGKVTKEYSNGSVYVGEMKDGKRNGLGTMTYSSGAVYTGEWKNDVWDGHGKYIWPSGNFFEGEYRNGKQNGFGKHTWTSGASFEGEYKDGKRNGHGKITYANGNVYEGEFKDGEKHGQGKYTRTDGTTVTEVWDNGKKIS